ncbi:MAG: hypothetical protein JNK15_10880 [Planctomycetes bacterium]|nr:hypothetical protein [Planctomycetota bacterium]
MVKNLLAALAALALAPAVAAQAPVERVGAHFTLQFHPGRLPVELAGKLADEALAAVESTWAPIERLVGAAKASPTVVHLYSVTTDYRAKEKEIASSVGMRHHVVAHATREAHADIWPALAAKDLETIGLPEATRESLVRAAAELLVGQRSAVIAIDPWLAEVVAVAVLEGKQALAPAYGVDWAFDSRRRLFDSCASPPTLRSVVQKERPAAGLEFEWAENEKAMVAQLFAASGGDWARKLLQSPGKTGTNWRVVRDAAVERVLGKDWSKSEAKWQKQIAAVRCPFWVVSPHVERQGARLLLVGSSEDASTVFAQQPVPVGSYRIKARCQIASASDSSLRIQLDWDQTSMAGVLVSRHLVEVGEWRDDGKGWRIDRAAKATIPYDTPFDLVVEVGVVPNTLVVTIDGVETLRWDCTARTMRGVWSVARNAGVAVLDGLVIEAVAAPAKGR